MRRLFGVLLAAAMASFGLVLASPGSPAVAGEACFIAGNGAGVCFDSGLGVACPGGAWVGKDGVSHVGPFWDPETQKSLLGATPQISDLPSPAGTAPFVGWPLAVNTCWWIPDPVTTTIQWKRDGTAIPGANTATYSPGAADLGKRITVTVTGAKPGFATVQHTSDATLPVVPARTYAAEATPALSGTPALGWMLRVSNPCPDLMTPGYQWNRNGSAIQGATGATYRLTSNDVGQTVSATVSCSRPEWATQTKTSASTSVIQAFNGANPPNPPADTTAPVVTATPAGIYEQGAQISLSSNETALIYYTTDGSAPTTTSPIFADQLTLTATTTLRYLAVDTAGNASAAASQTYVVPLPDLTAPSAAPNLASGSYAGTQLVSFTTDKTAAVYYTLDGSTPTPSSTPFTAPIRLDPGTTTIRYMAVDTAGNVSVPASASYTLQPLTFSDVPVGTQFHDEISWLAGNLISTGWTESDGSRTYRPVTSINRDAMAAFLYRLAGEPIFTPPASSPFTDVATDNPFYKQITWLAAKGISTGYAEPDGTKTFRPLSPVNRDAMAAFLHRLYLYKSTNPAGLPPFFRAFRDVPQSAQFSAEINWLANSGISTGWPQPDGSKVFQPLQPVNRDAMAAFLYRYHNAFQG